MANGSGSGLRLRAPPRRVEGNMREGSPKRGGQEGAGVRRNPWGVWDKQDRLLSIGWLNTKVLCTAQGTVFTIL